MISRLRAKINGGRWKRGSEERERAVVFRHKCQTQGGIRVGAFKLVSRWFALSKLSCFLLEGGEFRCERLY